MRDGSGTTLELLADAPQFSDELAGLADGKVSLGDLFHGLAQVIGDIAATVTAKIALCIGIMLKVIVEFHTVMFHGDFLPYDNYDKKAPLTEKAFCQGRIHTDPRCHLDSWE
jgi:hypothetical protein